MLKFYRIIFFTVLLVLTSACSNEKTPGPPLVSVSLSGTITPALFSSMDSDVNNPDASFVSNDTIATHQVLSNPVILGGYLNLPGRGPSLTQSTGKPPGRSLNQGDVVDIYKVDLKVGQLISLKIAEDPASVNLRLRLINSLGEVINEDLASGQTQTLTVVQEDIVAGDYYVQVAIYCPNSFSIACGFLPAEYLGHSNYTLSIGQVSLRSSSVDLNSEIVPGDIIVKFKQDSNPIQAVGVNALAIKADVLGLSVEAGAIGRYSLLKIDNSSTSNKSKLGSLAASVGNGLKVLARQSDPQRELKLKTLLTIQALRRRSDVEYAGPNLIRRALRAPNDTDYGRQWNLGFINLPQAWDITTGTAKNGTSVIVAVIDSGVLLNHPDMVGQLVSGYDFVKDVNYSADGDGLDADPADPGDRPVCNVAAGCFMTTSSSFHGTHVAGTIAARSNDNTGIAGVSWGAKIMPIRALGREGFGTSYDVMQGVRYAAGIKNDSRKFPAQKADIINLSLGGPIPDAFEEAIFGLVREAGVIVVAAAGNESTSSPVYPAAYDGIISVSAVDSNERLAPYSNFGSSIDVTAPGGSILLGPLNQKIVDKAIYSSLGDDSSGVIRFAYGYYQGTSMAAPHVAGVLALMKAVNPALTPADIDAKLRAGELTDDLGFSSRFNGFGWGLINAFKAVKSAQNGTVPPVGPELSATADKLLFAEADREDLFRLENTGSGSITVNNIAITYTTPGESWLSIIASNADASGLGQYVARIDRTGLAEDIYSAKIIVTSDQGIAEIQILMQVADPIKAAKRNVGEIYAFIYNGNSGELVQQVKSVFSNGKYSYTFGRIPEGEYLLMAGNDSDNDYKICGRYESCGAYKYLSRPALISVNGTDIDNIDFTVAFDQAKLQQTQNINALGIE